MFTDTQANFNNDRLPTRMFWGSATTKTIKNIFSANKTFGIYQWNTTHRADKSSKGVNLNLKTVDYLLKKQFFSYFSLKNLDGNYNTSLNLNRCYDNHILEKFSKNTLKTFTSLKNSDNFKKFVNPVYVYDNDINKKQGSPLVLRDKLVQRKIILEEHFEDGSYPLVPSLVNPSTVDRKATRNDYLVDITKGQNKFMCDTPKLWPRKVATPKRLITEDYQGYDTTSLFNVDHSLRIRSNDTSCIENIESKSIATLCEEEQELEVDDAEEQIEEDHAVLTRNEENGTQTVDTVENSPTITAFREEGNFPLTNLKEIVGENSLIVEKSLINLLEENSLILSNSESYNKIKLDVGDVKCITVSQSLTTFGDALIHNDLLLEANTIKILLEEVPNRPSSPLLHNSSILEETLKSDESDLNIGYLQIPEPSTFHSININHKNSLTLAKKKLLDRKQIFNNISNRRQKCDFKIVHKSLTGQKVPNLKTILSPVGLYINNCPKVPQLKRIYTKSPNKRGSFTKHSTQKMHVNKPQECNLPHHLYKPAKQNLMIRNSTKEFSKNVQKLITNTPEIIKHKGRINKNKLNTKNVEELLLKENLTAGDVLNVSSASVEDVSLLSSKKALIK